MRNFILWSVLIFLTACSGKNSKPIFWIYTSVYKDTVADLQNQLAKAFPEIEIRFFQAGSEDLAAKINAEELAGQTQADLLIFSDPFWYQEMAEKNRFHAYVPAGAEKVLAEFRHPEGYFTPVSYPLMVMIYNSSVIAERDAPKTFKEVADGKWKGKFTTGSPLASGTNFTTVAFLQKAYGWEYFKALRKNDTISEGGNSSVIRRVQTKERPIGWVLLENVLRFQDSDSHIKIIYPEDGAIVQTNALALVKKAGDSSMAKKIADWFFAKEGQEAMIRSFMYAAVPGYPPPKGAPTFESILQKSQKWDPETLAEFKRSRESIKDEFAKIMLQ